MTITLLLVILAVLSIPYVYFWADDKLKTLSFIYGIIFILCIGVTIQFLLGMYRYIQYLL